MFLLLALSVLPVILLMIFIYRQDKYQKEPIKSLAKAFIGGILAIPLDFIIIFFINRIWMSDTVFYSAFWEAGFPEELSKLLIFMIFIWRDKNLDEYMDGIVYASFIGLGFACIENILYVFGAAGESFGSAIHTSIARAILSVPGHFLFGVVMGYFLSLAKFQEGRFWPNLLLGFLSAAGVHGLFDWLLMLDISSEVNTILYIVFLAGDFFLWKTGIKYIRKQQENSRRQAKDAAIDEIKQKLGITDTDDGPDYKHIDWNAGDQ